MAVFYASLRAPARACASVHVCKHRRAHASTFEAGTASARHAWVRPCTHEHMHTDTRTCMTACTKHMLVIKPRPGFKHEHAGVSAH
eukprot:15434092-Alexandrium_andersonii.AAC.1